MAVPIDQPVSGGMARKVSRTTSSPVPGGTVLLTTTA